MGKPSKCCGTLFTTRVTGTSPVSWSAARSGVLGLGRETFIFEVMETCPR